MPAPKYLLPAHALADGFRYSVTTQYAGFVVAYRTRRAALRAAARRGWTCWDMRDGVIIG